MNKVKVGVIGCGMISGIYLKNCAQTFEILEVAACADLVPELAQKQAAEFGIARACSVEELLADPEIEIVVDLTVPWAHAQVNRDILQTGKHVYTEKPFALNAADADGVLQDVHWSRPGFGYFPTYALGNLYAAQFYETAVTQNTTIIDEMAQGRTDSLVAWLVENIHQHGKKYTPRELVQRVTGQPLDHAAFIRYATTKFSDIYGL